MKLKLRKNRYIELFGVEPKKSPTKVEKHKPSVVRRRVKKRTSTESWSLSTYRPTGTGDRAKLCQKMFDDWPRSVSFKSASDALDKLIDDVLEGTNFVFNPGILMSLKYTMRGKWYSVPGNHHFDCPSGYDEFQWRAWSGKRQFGATWKDALLTQQEYVAWKTRTKNNSTGRARTYK